MQLRIQRKMRLNQQSEPPPFLHMNPFSKNPGTAPAMPIMDGHPGRMDGRIDGCMGVSAI